MPEFISKLQYKHYEKGEYSDEQIRNLEETIELVRNFPWENQKHGEIGLTGPSVTIENSSGKYLKAGIYYGGKLSIYFFDGKYHYYEKKNVGIDEVIDNVSEFFDGNLKLENYEKQGFSLLLKGYFLTKNFEYRIKLWKALLLSMFWIFYFSMFLYILFEIEVSKPLNFLGVFPSLFVLLFGVPLALLLNDYYKKKNQYLKISRGNDYFQFGYYPDNIKSYCKNDIVRIDQYLNSSRGPNAIEVYEIYFADTSRIKITNVLLSGSTLKEKFSRKWTFPINTIWQNVFKMLPLILK